ncbi:hypothetical protein, partial [Microtetraspora sp. AC03309]|uniref:hypothetical protein n=1 Tax=Microtetraspora sp. AC03309 TaxID=2779376 RepID=UPI001E283D3E
MVAYPAVVRCPVYGLPVLAHDVGDHTGPAALRVEVGVQFAEQRQRELEFDDPATANRRRPRVEGPARPVA